MARDGSGTSFWQWQRKCEVAIHTGDSQEMESTGLKQGRVKSLTGDPPSKTMPSISKAKNLPTYTTS